MVSKDITFNVANLLALLAVTFVNGSSVILLYVYVLFSKLLEFLTVDECLLYYRSNVYDNLQWCSFVCSLKKANLW